MLISARWEINGRIMRQRSVSKDLCKLPKNFDLFEKKRTCKTKFGNLQEQKLFGVNRFRTERDCNSEGTIINYESRIFFKSVFTVPLHSSLVFALMYVCSIDLSNYLSKKKNKLNSILFLTIMQLTINIWSKKSSQLSLNYFWWKIKFKNCYDFFELNLIYFFL